MEWQEDWSHSPDIMSCTGSVSSASGTYPMSCRSVNYYTILEWIGEGTYGEVFKAKEKNTGRIFAIKKMKLPSRKKKGMDESNGVPISIIREVKALMLVRGHENIINLEEVVNNCGCKSLDDHNCLYETHKENYENLLTQQSFDSVFLVMEYIEMDLKRYLDKAKKSGEVLLIGEIKCIISQLLKAVAFLHGNGIIHRDIKPANILLSRNGVIKLADFGLAREIPCFHKGVSSLTPTVVTLWYRAPEILLGCNKYCTPIDVWSIGTVFGELLDLKPLFPGFNDINQLQIILQNVEITDTAGSTLPNFLLNYNANDSYLNLKSRFYHRLSDSGVDLLKSLLKFDPDQRITAEGGLLHSYFKENPTAVDPGYLPFLPKEDAFV